jgi:hypothetical protein
VTAGNFLTTARSNDKRFPVDLLTQDKNKAQPFKLAPPPYYYGRLLFEDGTPPIIDKKPWPGAEIFVDFPYAGVARPDAQGYFCVCFDRAQFDQLIEQKSRKNIYVPEKQSGSSTARAVFPPTLLSTDKSKAGVVKIPKPAYGPGA